MRSCVHESIITTNSTVAATTTADSREYTSLLKKEKEISVSHTNKCFEVV
jgi:2-keto-3-deoxy-galactonokinase